MPTAARCWRCGAGSRPACGPGSRARALPKSNAARWPPRPAMRRICMPSRPSRSGPTARAETLYLHTSPEFAAKKLLAAGETQDLRIRPRLPQPRARPAACAGIHHAGMVPGARRRYAAVMRRRAGAAARWRPRSPAPKRCAIATAICDPVAEAERLTVADAFRIHAGIDLLDTLSHRRRRRSRCAAPRGRGARGIRVADDDDWSDIFSKVLAPRDRAAGWGWSGSRFSTEYPRLRSGAGAAQAARSRAWRSASSFMPAAWSWPTALAN